MPEWFQGSLMNGSATTPGVLAWRIGVAFLLGLAVSGIYRWAKRGESIPSTFLTTLILLSTLIAMATQVIGDNVARAFSLVGALSVVRFRTVVKDSQDTAFVIFAVIVGMASGSNHLMVAMVGLAILGAASLLLWSRPSGETWQSTESELTLRMSAADGVRAATETLLTASTSQCSLVAVATARKGGSLDLIYRVRLRPEVAPTALVAQIKRLEGVESVDLSRRS